MTPAPNNCFWKYEDVVAAEFNAGYVLSMHCARINM